MKTDWMVVWALFFSASAALSFLLIEADQSSPLEALRPEAARQKPLKERPMKGLASAPSGTVQKETKASRDVEVESIMQSVRPASDIKVPLVSAPFAEKGAEGSGLGA